MVLEARKSWISHAVIIARIFVASTLLSSACTTILHPGLEARLVSGVELLLGLIVAAGWHMRYAAGLALLGTVGALSTSFLATLFRTGSWGSHNPAAIALVIASGFLLYFGRGDVNGDISSIREDDRSSRLEPSLAPGDLRDADFEVTVRLERVLSWPAQTEMHCVIP